ncbi:hypothetical protein ART_4255 [Arthrobacter sp. PAMC 25486]|nr:hypothetical protein ART_4255 [Arthrobacter sp. PAMC 25486]
MIVPSTLPAHDAGDTPLPPTAPAAEVESGNETPTAPAEAEAEKAADAEVQTHTEAETQVEPEAEVTAEADVEPDTGVTAKSVSPAEARIETEAAVAVEPAADAAATAETDVENAARVAGGVETQTDEAAEAEVDAESGAQARAEVEVQEPTAAQGLEVDDPAGAAPEVAAEADSAAVDEPETADAPAVEPEAGPDVDPDVAAGIVAPAELAETTPAAAEVGEDGKPGEEPLPQSRRERRLAEQQLGSAVVPPKTETSAAATKPTEKTVDAASAAPAKPARKRGRLTGALRGLLFLLVISAVILGLGTVLSSTADNHAGPSHTEVDRQAAWEATNSLLEQAAELGTAGNKQEVQELLAQTATDLAAQGAALSDGLPPGTATATAAATALAPATVEALVLGLRTNGEALLQDAVGADHAMGRVFAAVGTSQLLRSQAVAAAADLTPVDSPALPASVNFPVPDAPECSSTLDPRPGASVDAALLAAAEGEQKAIYAYQVATPHLSEAQLKRGTALLARHEAKLTSLNAELEVRCLPGTSLVPGFTLAADFTTHPAAALASLEGELAAVFADLAAVSTAPSTATATTGTPATAGVPSANTTQLREMAVAWLVDSADAQAGWGGSVGALAGMGSGT